MSDLTEMAILVVLVLAALWLALDIHRHL